MDTIHINNIVISGRHGLSSDKDEFSVSLRMWQIEKPYGDDLKNTYDYREAVKIVRRVVEGQPRRLIETLGEDILKEILESGQITEAEITISRPNFITPAKASVILRRRVTGSADIIPFSVENLLFDIERFGGASVALLPEDTRRRLLAEAETLAYREQPREVNHGLVREEIAVADRIIEGGAIETWRENFESYLWREISAIASSDAGGRSFFATSPVFNELAVQRYRPGSIGITPHRDGYKYKNLICVIILSGGSKFALCDDRSGRNPRYLDTTPGRAIFLRAPGFCASSRQPFHYVSDIVGDRYVIGLRQKVG